MKIIEWFKRNPCVKCDYYSPSNNCCQSKKCVSTDPNVNAVDRMFCEPYYKSEEKKQKDICVDCKYYLVDPLSDPCDECIGKAGFGYNRFAHKKNNIRNNYGWVGWLINMPLYVVALGVASKHNDQTGCVIFSACLIFIFGMFLKELAE